MPVKSCSSDGKPGYKFGDAGKCYTYTAGDESSKKRAKQKAINQGIAMGEIEVDKFEVRTEFTKFDEDLGLVMGWIIVCNKNGEPYFDLHGDHIPEDAMLKAAEDFMSNSRTAKEMHVGESRGSIVFAWPLTAEIAKAFDIETETTGLMIAMKPDEDMLAKFQSGELTGFSIGGFRGEDEEVD